MQIQSTFYQSDGMTMKSATSLQDFLTTFPFPGGVVCKSSKFPNSIFLVGTESHGLQENRCLLSIPLLETTKVLCVSTVQPNFSCFSEGHQRQYTSYIDNSHQEDPILKSLSSSSVLQKSNSSCDRQLVDSNRMTGNRGTH